MPSAAWLAAAAMFSAVGCLPLRAFSTAVARTGLALTPEKATAQSCTLPSATERHDRRRADDRIVRCFVCQLLVRAARLSLRRLKTNFGEQFVLAEGCRHQVLEEVRGLDRPLAIRPLRDELRVQRDEH